MGGHKVYRSIVEKEPFTKHDLRLACSGLGEGTYNAF